jgi:RHS repeat-associated protein
MHHNTKTNALSSLRGVYTQGMLAQAKLARYMPTRGVRYALAWCLVSLLGGLPVLSQAQILTETRVTAYEYDAKGFVTKQIIEPDRADSCLQSSYTYDLWGNRSASTSSPCANVPAPYNWSAETARTSSTRYDAQPAVPAGLFPTSSTNAVGQSETRNYDPRFGVVTKLTGPNQLDTVWSYDNFGRKTKELRADKTYTTWVYKLCSDATAATSISPAPACPSPIGGTTVAWVAIEQGWGTNAQPITTEKRQYFDTLDRVVRVQTQSFDGGFAGGSSTPLVQDTEYDALGRVARSSDMYTLASPSTARWTSYVYDSLDRVVEQSVPDVDANNNAVTAYTRFEYNGLSTKATNPLGQTKTSIKNARGQIAQVIDHLGSTIAYQYDPFGNLLETNAAGSITRMRYDIRGNKLSMQDPAMGQWSYASNVYGELVSQTDSMKKTTLMSYDKLGRMNWRKETDLESNWSYDTYFGGAVCNKGIGKLCEAKTVDGNGVSDYSRKHSYDQFGREVATTTKMGPNALPATISVAYNPTTSFVASKTWPTGYTAGYKYSRLGYLTHVTGFGGGAKQTASYSVTAMNAHGQVLSYIHGNGTWGSKGYNPRSGRLVNINLNKPYAGPNLSSLQLLNLSYNYDTLSNLIKRVDTNPGGLQTSISEGFSYDGLNRLTNYTAIGGNLSLASDPNASVQVIYDVRGNITYKSDVGQYWYDQARPNRMTAVTLSSPAGGQPLTGSRAMAYAFDDYSPGAQTVNGTVLGNGNLMYTVSQDTKNNRHTVRWEDYTSFNMPKQIKYASLVNTAAGVSTGASIAATPAFCPPRTTKLDSNCLSEDSSDAIVTCSSGYYPMGGGTPDTDCYRIFEGNFQHDWNITYTCPAGRVLLYRSCHTPLPASVINYTCPTGYQLSGTQCTVFTNNASSGANSTSSDRTLTFVYGPEHQRISQRVELSPNAPANLQSGAGTTWYFNGDDGLGLSYEKEQKLDGSVEHKHYVSAGGITFALATIKTASLVSNAPVGSTPAVLTSTLSYLHNDHLGSIVAITDDTGAVVERLAYDPWGRRRFTDGKADQLDSLKGQKTDRGYTEHEHLDEMGLIHMNGRVYDPLVGRFMSADDVISDPYAIQAFNRYSYVWNNPLQLTDPTGHEPYTNLTITDSKGNEYHSYESYMDSRGGSSSSNGDLVAGGVLRFPLLPVPAKPMCDAGCGGMGGGAPAYNPKTDEYERSLTYINDMEQIKKAYYATKEKVKEAAAAMVKSAENTLLTVMPSAGLALNTAQIVNNALNVNQAADVPGADNAGDKAPSTPTGQRGSPIDVEPGTNEPTTIGDRDYTGHSLDRMQGRGVPPSAVEDAIQNGRSSPGNQPGTTVHTGSNGVTVVTGRGGRVITVIPR